MNDLIENIYKTRVVYDESGNEYQLHSEVDKFEGELLRTVISSDPTIRRTLEVGCAYGLSSLHICSALSTRESARHVIVDPVQHAYWHGVGIYNLKRAGFTFFELIEKPSEFILPELAQREAGTYDMVFIDGVHTFDHTLLDFFYASQLIRIGGYIVLDDCTTASISKVVSYVSQYPCYRLLPQFSRNLDKKSPIARIAKGARLLLPRSMAVYLLPKHLYDRYYSRVMYPSMVVLKKVEADERNSDWFAAF
ncbi:MAG TPA: class I SAM-dependent methyltransferase [Thermodesulfobacteriota bacterium]|nr:class I SAM-dependent methyltransferase [Thermodesulfobacteriota bacterium]